MQTKRNSNTNSFEVIIINVKYAPMCWKWERRDAVKITHVNISNQHMQFCWDRHVIPFFSTPMFPCEHGVYRETVWMPRDCSLLLVLLLFIFLFSDATFERMKRAFTLSYFIIKRKHIWVPLRKVIYKINTALLFGVTIFFFHSELSHKLFNLHFLSLTAYYNCIDQPTPRTECLFLVE